MHQVYILQSQKDNGYYIGSTSDIGKRLFDHNRGKTQSTRHRRPLELVLLEKYNTKTEALKREKYLKSLKNVPYLKKIIAEG